jgi:CheY-like chemotaxis protein
MWSGSGQEADRLTREEFIKQLHDDLYYLYNADRLRRSPLAALFGVANRFDSSSALRRILTEAIESLKPKADAPSQSRAWLIHDSLFCCFVQQLSQQVVADQLGMSARQLRREQRAALEILADRLWEQFDLETRLREGSETGTLAGPTASEELAWLKDIPPEKPTDLNQTLSEVLDLARRLAVQHDVHLEVETADVLPSLAVHPVALSQILLNLLSVAIAQSPGNRVHISARPLRWEVEIRVQGMQSSFSPMSISDDDAASLELAHQLAGMCGGKLVFVGQEGEDFSAILTFPALAQLPVLVIDDNADTLQLLQRYTTGTRYRLIGTRDPEKALEMAEKLSPQIIVLDVMMPQVDGWKVLGRLRQHPLTGHIPLVVCTILAQESLALSLGANAFIKKPVTRQAFLATLDHQVARMIETVSR